VNLFESERPSPESERLALDFLTRARKHNKAGKRYREQVPVWARALDRLAASYGTDKVRAVMLWYRDNLDTPYAPNCCDATVLTMKFARLVELWESSPGGGSAKAVSATALALASVIRAECTFPLEVQSRLDELVQDTVDAWKTFAKVLRELLPSRSRLERDFLFRVLELHGPVFVPCWWVFIANRFHGLDNYSGRVRMLVFFPGHPWFYENFWRNWAFAWCGQVRPFDDLLGMVIQTCKLRSATAPPSGGS
jgi:hypothetical protein